MQGLCEPDLLVVVLVLCLGEPGQQRRDGLHVADPGPGPRRAGQGRVLAVGGHGQDGVQRVVVGGAQAAHHREQLPGGNISISVTVNNLLNYKLVFTIHLYPSSLSICC